MKTKERLKQLKMSTKGITLIALVVTIIVLLIIAGIAISLTIGNNGIFARAERTKIVEIETRVKEEVKLAVYTANIAINEERVNNYNWNAMKDGILPNEAIARAQTSTFTNEATNGVVLSTIATYLNKEGYYIDVSAIATKKRSITVEYEGEDYKKATKDAEAKITCKIKVTEDVCEVETGEDIGNTEEKMNYDELVADLQSNPDKYTKPEGQTETDDIGINQYGQTVNLNDWIYELMDNSYFKLEGESEYTGHWIYYPAFTGELNADKEIEGGIPVLIKQGENTYPVSSLGNGALAGLSGLVSLEIPDTITNIGDEAFNGCSSLENVTIPNSVTNIGQSAFAGCSALQSVTISNSVDKIAYRTFLGCSSLKSITIPNSVKSIDPMIFEGCTSLDSIIVEKGSSLTESNFNYTGIDTSKVTIDFQT